MKLTPVNKRWVKMTRRMCVLATVVILATGPIAKAAPITYTFEGTVTSISAPPAFPQGVTVGEQIPISITVDPSLDYPITSALFNNVNKSSYPAQIISVQIGSSISFRTVSPMVEIGFVLALTGAHNGALPTSALPASLNPADFTGGVFEIASIYSGITGLNAGYGGTINGIGTVASVPEPSSLLLLSVGSLGLGWQAARRRSSS